MGRKLSLLTLIQALCLTLVSSDELQLYTRQDFLNFLSIVNSGRNYYTGTTVFLNNDISFNNETIEPIGKLSSSGYFSGTFDGKGHIISELHISSSTSFFSGLFGYSDSSTIKNTVIGNSCSFSFSQSLTDSGTDINIGSISGWCEKCVIENIVNMGSLTFSGHLTTRNLVMGGIVGKYTYSSAIKNCANFGTITYCGTITVSGSDYITTIGGITGYGGSSSSSTTMYIQNCVNYGTILHNDTTSTSTLSVGGILGQTFYNVVVENCLSGGLINVTSNSGYIGSVFGYPGETYPTATVKHCYWTSDVGYTNGCGDSSSVQDSSIVTSYSTTLTNLNGYFNENTLNKWILNENNHQITFITSNNNGFTVSSKLILLPDPIISTGLTFKGWYSDPYCTVDFVSTTEIDSSMSLYSLYGQIVTVNFDGNEGTPSNSVKYVTFNDSYGVLPDGSRIGYNLNGWYDNAGGSGYQVMENTSVNTLDTHTLYADWSLASFVLTLDYANGTEINTSVLYSHEIVCPESAEREGYTFDGWNDTTTSMPAYNLTISAQWTINNYTVTFIFNDSTSDPIDEVFNYSETIVYPIISEREGYTFDGWINYTELMPAYNLIITAQWSVKTYTLTFDYGNGTEVSSSLEYNQQFTHPDDPKKEGYTFNGWNNTGITTMPAYNLTIFAQWSINNYTVIFDFNNESEPEVKTLNYSETIVYPIISEREGYIFNGWLNYTELMPAHNLIITAQWSVKTYTLTFDYGNGTEVSSSLEYNQQFTHPDSPEKEGYTFDGWNDTTTSMPAYNLTISAQWSINNYTVIFDFNNESEPEVKILNYSETIEYPIISEREGYTFNGWLNYIELMPAYNLVVTAQWNINEYEITFDFSNGTTTKKIFKYNEIIEYPSNVKKEGYVFNGWSSKPERMPSQNVTVVSRWVEANQYVEITFNSVSLTQSEIIEMLNQYTTSNYHVDSFEVDSVDGSTQVIIKFEDPEKAQEFVRTVSVRIGKGDDYIRDVSAYKNQVSLSSNVYPFSLLFLYFLF